MNLVFIYLGEECLVIIYSVSELAMGKVPVCLQPAFLHYLVFVLYFSAHWCPPCRQFTPILAQQFSIYRQASSKATVIFVSGDRSFQEQLNYMREAHGDWPAVRCDSSLTSRLNSVFQVRGIPKVVVVKVSNGECISQDGRQDIMQNGALAFSSWEQSCIEIDTSIGKKSVKFL